MFRKLIKGLVVSSLIVLLPVVGNTEMIFAFKIWLIFSVGILASILQPDYKITEDKLNARDHGTEGQIIWSVIITQLLAVCEAAYLGFPGCIEWSLVSIVAFSFVCAGLALRTWSVYSLGMFFTMHLSVQKEHRVIRLGPYKYLRHPSYLGALFMYVGIPVFLHSWYSSALAAVILPFAWARRIYYEEKMLREELGEEYLDYCKNVKRVLPGLW